MKFTDGYWRMRPGVTPHFPMEVHEVMSETDALTVVASTKKIVQRGDTLNLPLLTLRFSSPMLNVIRVQILHHRGGGCKKPSFEINEDPARAVLVTDNPDYASLTSGGLSARIEKKKDWKIEFEADGKLITSSGQRAMGFMDTPEGPYIIEKLRLGVGDYVYGLGERFTPFIKNGQVVDIWNEDGGTSSEQAYKNIPFYLSNRGYGIFVNQPERVSFEVASENVECVQFSVPGESLEYFVIYGPTPKDVLTRYAALTGFPALPPAWSFGLWLSTSFTTNYDEPTVTGLIEDMIRRDLPLHVFHFDCFWMKAFRWCDFQWDARTFPDPAGMLKRLKDRGLHICVWINPYIAQCSTLFDEAVENGYLLKRKDGRVWQTDLWQAGMGIVDFTNPKACQWFGEKLRVLAKMGVDSFKTDFGERIPTDVVYHDGSDPHRMHNYFSFLYNRTVHEILRQVRGENEVMLFARSATAGGQRFPVHWGGDSTATYESMAESLRGGLSLGMSGFGFWSHDIGGFEHTATADLYKRWCAFGLLSSHSRLHGSDSCRVPWIFDEEAVDVLRLFTKLKCRLMPYLFCAAIEAHQKGIPMLRSMLLEFPKDPACETLDRQYMLGESLLVAPVFSPDGQVTFFVPAGLWTSILSGKEYTGPAWITEFHDYKSLPLLARPNSVIPFGICEERPDYDYIEKLTLNIYAFEQGKTIVTRIPTLDGKFIVDFEVQSSRETVAVRKRGLCKEWRILLVGVDSLKSVDQGSCEDHPSGMLITPDPGADTVEMIMK